MKRLMSNYRYHLFLFTHKKISMAKFFAGILFQQRKPLNPIIRNPRSESDAKKKQRKQTSHSRGILPTIFFWRRFNTEQKRYYYLALGVIFVILLPLAAETLLNVTR